MYKIKVKFEYDYYGKIKKIKYVKTFDDYGGFLDFLSIFVSVKNYNGCKIVLKKYSIKEVKK